MFGPHVTNLGEDDRSFSERHVAYYERRASGGCGLIVTEGASVHDSDWPYERSPLAQKCRDGWKAIADACHGHGTLVVASLDHAGGQGSSAYSQRPLWAPSRVPEVNSREVPKWMEDEDIEAVISGFADSARLALEAGCDGIEINAGQHSLVRQFLSGLTNQRGDAWGTDRLLFARRVIEAAARAARDADPNAIVGLRLSCDELAPWAGITPEMAPEIAHELSSGIDYVVVVRGSIFSVEKTRPDFHEPAGFNIDTCRAVRDRIGSKVAVFLQGSIVEVESAQWAVSANSGPVCDAVEMTRAQIADPDLVNKIGGIRSESIRPCVLCNQACQVRDARNPIVSCIVEPTSGHESRDPNWYVPASVSRRVLVVGAGPSGLEAARVARLRGHQVRIIDRSARIGGLAAHCGPAGPFVAWQESELKRLGVDVEVGVEAASFLPSNAGAFDVVVQAIGSRPGSPDIALGEETELIDIADIHSGAATLPADGSIVILDPIGGPIGVGLAETLGSRAVLVTQDNIAGNELSRTGDLAPANVRLARSGVTVVRRGIPRSASRRSGGSGTITVSVQDRFSGETLDIECSAVVDAGFRLPAEPLSIEGPVLFSGDCIAPRTVLEAVLEGRRAALAV